MQILMYYLHTALIIFTINFWDRIDDRLYIPYIFPLLLPNYSCPYNIFSHRKKMLEFLPEKWLCTLCKYLYSGYHIFCAEASVAIVFIFIWPIFVWQISVEKIYYLFFLLNAGYFPETVLETQLSSNENEKSKAPSDFPSAAFSSFQSVCTLDVQYKWKCSEGKHGEGH